MGARTRGSLALLVISCALSTLTTAQTKAQPPATEDEPGGGQDLGAGDGPAGEPVPAPPEGAGTAEPSDTAEPATTELEPPVEEEDEWVAEESGGALSRIFDTRLYGYIGAYWEKVANTPAGVDPMTGQTITEGNPHEFDVLNLHVMVQGAIMQKFRYFLNIAAPGAGSSTSDEVISVRNAWVEAPIFGDYLNIRFGKTYRTFGLYNEILDATPTFIGIEPPELFDGDHLMLTRTTNLMLHGRVGLSDHVVSYSLATGNDERASDEVPIGADVHVDLASGMLRLGSSFYWTGGDAAPARGVGEGPPPGGVSNWMAEDEYMVFGGYAELNLAGLILQAAYWQAEHKANRDEEEVLKLADSGQLNPRQLDRFFVDGDPMQGVRNDNADYTVRTAYLRAGYELMLGDATLTPYVQFDYYDNPETVASKDLGGDNEAGLSDTGAFYKSTAGFRFRPIVPVALKADVSVHHQEFNGEMFHYPEVRVSLSYLWELAL